MNADFESGFAHDLEELAANVRRAVNIGVAGLSIEDIRADGGPGFYDTDTSVERIRTARAALDHTGEDVILVARTEILLSGSAARGR
ncbi:2-methylisocitrate lyase-like PEP mutase family enzyme [Azospirillum melinis]|nr:2-methylisocitrate lyase-like PEP mutase family enzyme [Azospirillum melinis]